MFYQNGIRKARLAKGISQIELGNKVGVSYGTMSRLERGHIRTAKELRRKVSKVLRVSEIKLFPGSGNNRKSRKK